jgi:tripartite ATP-independent transporter DctM subunit
MIIYGVLTNTSIPQLYLAAMVPGLVLAAIFTLTIIIRTRFSSDRLKEVRIYPTWAERFSSLRHLLPPLAIFTLVIGSLYAGLATPTESAALGVVGVLVLAAARRTLRLAMLRTAFEGCMRTTAMIMLIIVFAYFLNFVLAGVGLTTRLNGFIAGLGLSPFETLLAVIVFYIVLGCFMETLSMMITTIPIVAPVIFAAGYDPVWFGVMMMVLVELAMITPPIGVNLYVVQSIREKGRIADVIAGVIPFIIAMLGMIALLVAFPQLTTVFI